MYEYAAKSDKAAGQKNPHIPNRTGIPDSLKKQYENKTGFSYDDVRIHYNSDKPDELRARAYTLGENVYIAPGQEAHLRHELGHVAQQKAGIVKPNLSINGFPLNSDSALEANADNISQLPKKNGDRT